MGFGVTGATSAAMRGGDIGAGMLFGVTAGTIAGLGLGAMGPAAEGAHVWAAMAEGAVVGTAAGATSAYAGGKGSIQETIFWAAIGNVSTAVLYGMGAALKAANPSKHAVSKFNSKAAQELSNRAKQDLALKLEEMRAAMKVDESINIALYDAADDALDILGAAADIIQQGASAGVEIIRSGVNAAGVAGTETGTSVGNTIWDTIYGVPETIRKYNELNNDSHKSFIFFKRLMGIDR